MAYDLPKLEARITVPAGGWPVTVTDSGGAAVITMPESKSYLSDFLAAFVALLNANGTLAQTYTGTIDDDGGSTATGRVTIGATGAASFTWGSSAFRDHLGYSGNLSSGTSHVSTAAARALYLPDYPIANPDFPDGSQGRLIAARTATVAPGGRTRVLSYGGRRAGSWEWRGISGRRTWAQFETYANESLESFWGEFLIPGVPFRYHWDRTDDAHHTTWQLIGPDIFPATPDVEGFVGGPGDEGAALHWSTGRLEFAEFTG